MQIYYLRILGSEFQHGSHLAKTNASAGLYFFLEKNNRENVGEHPLPYLSQPVETTCILCGPYLHLQSQQWWADSSCCHLTWSL